MALYGQTLMEFGDTEANQTVKNENGVVRKSHAIWIKR
jgi:hypothetical protein